MIWKSVFWMTAFDGMIVFLSVMAIIFFVQNKVKFRAAKAHWGARVILLGICSSGIFYLIDFIIMHIFPMIMPMTEAMAYMNYLHNNMSWFVVTFSTSFIVIGFIHVTRCLILTKEKEEKAVADKEEKESDLKAQNERFHVALENISHGVCVYDSEARLVICNERYASMYGLSKLNMTPGTTLRKVIQLRISNGFYAGGSPGEYIEERRLWTKDRGKIEKILEFCDGRSIHVSRQALSDGGWVATHVDITDSRMAERELIAHRDHLQELVEKSTLELKANSEELKEALGKEKELNDLQRQFVSMASHEFRTPLTIIDSAAQRLMSRADKGRLTPEDAAQRGRKIRDAVRRMTRLIESTLTAASMEEGKVNIDIGPCDIAKTISEVCERQQEIAEKHVISCNLSTLPETIKADTGALEQMLTNLLSNAEKYAPDAPDIEVKARTQGHQVVISVRDHGIGIDPEELSRVGERFFRAKTSTGIAGTGIGLNLTKSLIEMHDGLMNVESKKDEGSTFTIFLPIAGPDQAQQADASAA